MNVLCRHFGTCGGCTLQDLAPEQYLERKRRRIVDALARNGVDGAPLSGIETVPSHSRRRATLKVRKSAGETHIGFHAPRSHVLVDVRQCHVLTPGLFNLTQQLREVFDATLAGEESAELYMLEADNGFDLAISGARRSMPDVVARIAAAASKLNLIRVTSGTELLYQTAIPVVTFGKARLGLPPAAFLQPTREGEALLQRLVNQAVGTAKRVLDLFSGCGTFSLFLASRAQVNAFDVETSMLQALAAAARGTSGLKPLHTERRDLFKQPLLPAEINRLDAAVLDPPRAGALAQSTKLAQSRLTHIAYVSCDAASFARDARVLIDGGFRLDWIVGVDQFLWSAHIELAAAFSR
ncbi:MAG: class I SAM-dependent RNA methyltransferase [Alphaproteobacteria bacterium]|nr:class I SAM-dependent RNA methyltransferase [Alphaproteobacteria bacterium]